MKKVIFLFMAAAVLLSCQKSKEYTISGTVADVSFEGKNVYMQQIGDDAMLNVDTAVVTNGAFAFEGVADSTVLRFVSLEEPENVRAQNRVPVLVEAGKIDVKFDSVITVNGTKVNDEYTAFRLKQRDLNGQIRQIITDYNTAASAGMEASELEKLEEKVQADYDKVSEEMKSVSVDFVKGNIQNKLGQYIFMTSSSMFEPEAQKEILALADDSFKADENIQRIIKRLENYDKVAVGQKFTDFTMKDPQGNDVSLSNYAGQGKYLLIDFWASWCGPCIAEMPHVVEAYAKYKDKGFEVVGVSLDRDHEAWVKGIKDLNMTWPQMSDLLFWETPVVELYAFNGIPHTVLLDREGVIIDKNLRGSALDKKLAELMP